MREINFKFKQKGSLYSSYANIKFNQILLFLRRMLKSKSLHVIRLKRRRRKKTRSHFTFTRKDHHQTTRRKIQIFTTPRISSSITRPVTLVQVNVVAPRRRSFVHGWKRGEKRPVDRSSSSVPGRGESWRRGKEDD